MVVKDLGYFLSRTEPHGDCREWTKCFNTDGYPRVAIHGHSNGKVHREVFFLVNGFYPPVVRHSCDNIKCINPDHLLAGTQLDNNQDMVDRKRYRNQVSGTQTEAIVDLKQLGLSYKEIAAALNVTTKRVEYVLYRYSRKVG